MARILLVEDNPTMADAIRDVLEGAGHRVTIAADGVAGLDAIPKVSPDLILSDVMMPRMDGFEFYQAVRANPAWVFIPFVFLTARDQEQDINLGKRLGADDYLVKPYSPANLVTTVESKLTRSQAIARAAGAEMEGMKRTITRVLGHELRTPLTWIQGYAELLLGGGDSITSEELHLSLQSIKAGSDRLARLVEDAVLVIMLDTGQAKEEFNLMARVEDDWAPYIDQALRQLQPAANQHAVRLEFHAPQAVKPLLIAPRFFLEALLRIIENSTKFARPDVESYVVVSITDRPNEVEIVVSDNGVGIPADQLERIFAPLVQVGRSQLEQQGVGLGLTVARGLVGLHGGRIWAESTVGEGTQVHIALPYADPANWRLPD